MLSRGCFLRPEKNHALRKKFTHFALLDNLGGVRQNDRYTKRYKYLHLKRQTFKKLALSMLNRTQFGSLVMKRDIKANESGEQRRTEKRANENRAAVDRGNDSDVRPELGVLGWAARAQRLFGAMTLHA
ncbi:MAG: hypothetical protein ACXWIU_10850 [Limisphaerales bacterium]